MTLTNIQTVSDVLQRQRLRSLDDGGVGGRTTSAALALHDLVAKQNHLPHAIHHVLAMSVGNVKHHGGTQAPAIRSRHLLELVAWRTDRLLLETNSQHPARVGRGK